LYPEVAAHSIMLLQQIKFQVKKSIIYIFLLFTFTGLKGQSPKPNKNSPEFSGDFLFTNGICFLNKNPILTYNTPLLNKYSRQYWYSNNYPSENLKIKRNYMDEYAGLILISYLLDSSQLSQLDSSIIILSSNDKTTIKNREDKIFTIWIKKMVVSRDSEIKKIAALTTNNPVFSGFTDTLLPFLCYVNNHLQIVKTLYDSLQHNPKISLFYASKGNNFFDSFFSNNPLGGEYVDLLFSESGFYLKEILKKNHSYGSGWLKKSLRYYSETNQYLKLKDILDRGYLDLIDNENSKSTTKLYSSYLQENFFLDYETSSIERCKYIIETPNFFANTFVNYSNTFFRIAMYQSFKVKNKYTDSTEKILYHNLIKNKIEINTKTISILQNKDKKFTYQTYLEPEFYGLFLPKYLNDEINEIKSTIRNTDYSRFTIDSGRLSPTERWNIYLFKTYFNKNQNSNAFDLSKNHSYESLIEHVNNYNYLYPSEKESLDKRKLSFIAYYIVWQLNFNPNILDTQNLLNLVKMGIADFKYISFDRSYHILNCLKSKFDIAAKKTDSLPPTIIFYNTPDRTDPNIFTATESNFNFFGVLFDINKVKYLMIDSVKIDLDNGSFSHLTFLKPGPNDIEFIFEDGIGNKSKLIKHVNYESIKDKITTRKSYVLIFAVSDYFYNSEWKDLKNPILDAEYFSKVIVNYNFDTIIIRNPNKQLFYKTLYKYLDILKSRNNPYDQLVIMFTGHGDYEARTNQGYLVLQDSRNSGESYSRESYVSIDDLVIKLNRSKINNVLFLIDACHSGLISLNNASVIPPNKVNKTNNNYLQDKLSLKCRKFISSVGNVESYDGIPGEHSPFMKKLVNTLNNNKEETLSFEKLISSIQFQKTSVNVAKDKNKEVESDDLPQFGSFGDEESGSTFLFVKRQ
jgi:hypothetical protein